jgi:hypothetical protein
MARLPLRFELPIRGGSGERSCPAGTDWGSRCRRQRCCTGLLLLSLPLLSLLSLLALLAAQVALLSLLLLLPFAFLICQGSCSCTVVRRLPTPFMYNARSPCVSYGPSRLAGSVCASSALFRSCAPVALFMSPPPPPPEGSTEGAETSGTGSADDDGRGRVLGTDMMYGVPDRERAK